MKKPDQIHNQIEQPLTSAGKPYPERDANLRAEKTRRQGHI